MKIIIHRGINQIGGCITEIATTNNRILIDLGQNLPDNEGVSNDSLASREGIEHLTKGVDTIFYTHYHSDHLGLFNYVPDNIPQYIGKVSKKVTLCKYRQLSYIKGRKELSRKEMRKLAKMNEISSLRTIIVGDLKITPFLVSHSAYDAYMFLIEADGKKVLYTGDFRGHGYLSKGLLLTIKKLILPQGKIDILISEGTMLSRINEKVMTERELQRSAEEIMKQYKNVFVMCSSTDMERLASFYAANKNQKNRPIVCDRFQKNIFEIFTKSAGVYSSLFRFDKVYDFNPFNIKLIDWMEDKGFCMFVRATKKFKDYYRLLTPRLVPSDTVLIYSMWNEYVNNNGKYAIQRYLDFIFMFPNIKILHTSGHASAYCLAEVCKLISPTYGIIPIHSENSADYARLAIDENLKSKIILTTTCVGDINIKIV